MPFYLDGQNVSGGVPGFAAEGGVQGSLPAWDTTAEEWLDTIRDWGFGAATGAGIGLVNTTPSSAVVGNEEQWSPYLYIGGNSFGTGTLQPEYGTWRLWVENESKPSWSEATLHMDVQINEAGPWTNRFSVSRSGNVSGVASFNLTSRMQVNSVLTMEDNAESAIGIGGGNIDFLRSDSTRALALISRNVTDSAGVIWNAVVADTDAATLLGKAFSAGWTNNLDNYNERFFVDGTSFGQSYDAGVGSLQWKRGALFENTSTTAATGEFSYPPYMEFKGRVWDNDNLVERVYSWRIEPYGIYRNIGEAEEKLRFLFQPKEGAPYVSKFEIDENGDLIFEGELRGSGMIMKRAATGKSMRFLPNYNIANRGVTIPGAEANTWHSNVGDDPMAMLNTNKSDGATAVANYIIWRPSTPQANAPVGKILSVDWADNLTNIHESFFVDGYGAGISLTDDHNVFSTHRLLLENTLPATAVNNISQHPKIELVTQRWNPTIAANIEGRWKLDFIATDSGTGLAPFCTFWFKKSPSDPYVSILNIDQNQKLTVGNTIQTQTFDAVKSGTFNTLRAAYNIGAGFGETQLVGGIAGDRATCLYNKGRANNAGNAGILIAYDVGTVNKPVAYIRTEGWTDLADTFHEVRSVKGGGGVISGRGLNGQGVAWPDDPEEELLTLGSGVTNHPTSLVITKDTVGVIVTATVVTALPISGGTWNLGTNTTPKKFSDDDAAETVGASIKGTKSFMVWWQTADDRTIEITTSNVTTAATGQIRVQLQYITAVPATS